ncbi:hypothetical protein M9H77_07297 [Catharanthus roseus]|uniref:Uncharacterized protein n=1 Tax=Catharanthus roseus TaxID=4058 RepID=A0ACC0BUT9_CATRO|nr:hypothetical protein M9H77_07297 [Catharanthus roseus]
MAHPMNSVCWNFQFQPAPMHGHRNLSTTLKCVSSYKREPAIVFEDQEISSFIAPFKLSLIGGFHSFIAQRHMVISWISHEGVQMVYQFSPYIGIFCISSVDCLRGIADSLFQQIKLFSIARVIGKPLRIGKPTACLSRPSIARVCVKIDLLKPLPVRVCIGTSSRKGFWQPVANENLPPYCSSCFCLVHIVHSCKRRQFPLQPLENQVTAQPLSSSDLASSSRPQDQPIFGQQGALETANSYCPAESNDPVCALTALMLKEQRNRVYSSLLAKPPATVSDIRQLVAILLALHSLKTVLSSSVEEVYPTDSLQLPHTVVDLSTF